MKNNKTIFTGALFAVTAICLFGMAGAPAARAADCTVNAADLAALKAIQNNPALDSATEIQQELAMRKQLVATTINCAKTDVQAQSDALKKVSLTSDSQVIQTQLLDKLNDAMNFYTIELSKLDGAGLSSTQTVAKDVLAWRKGSYATLSGEINNFIIWSRNQDLFRTAQSRMNQTQRAVSFIESASGNADLQDAFKAATASFQTAQQSNAAAQSELAQFVSPDQSIASIKQSLQALSDTYQKLFTVSTLITKLLPS